MAETSLERLRATASVEKLRDMKERLAGLQRKLRNEAARAANDGDARDVWMAVLLLDDVCREVQNCADAGDALPGGRQGREPAGGHAPAAGLRAARTPGWAE
jgi:hypothetical protein